MRGTEPLSTITELFFTRTLNASDWDAICRRSPFVRRYHTLDSCFSPVMRTLLDNIPPPDVLFPNLREVTLDLSMLQTTNLQSGVIAAIAAPTLTHWTIEHLCFVMHPKELDISPFTRCDQLRNLESVGDSVYKFQNLDTYTSPYANFFDDLRACRDLTTIHLNLGVYEYLRRAHLDDIGGRDFGFNTLVALGHKQVTFSASRFPCLQHLTLKSFPPAFVRAIFAANPLLSLETLWLDADIDDCEWYHAFLSAVHQGCDPMTLREFGLDTRQVCWDEEFPVQSSPEDVFNLHALVSISTFARLTIVDLERLALAKLTDADCAVIAGWWPELVYLSLGTAESAPLCTGSALVSFRQSCPHLEYLKLAFRTDEESINEALVAFEGIAMPSPPLRFTLHANDSPINPEVVRPLAAFLLRVFPTLQRLDCGDFSSDMAIVWDEDEISVEESRRADGWEERDALWAEVADVVFATVHGAPSTQ
ncbi:hypothetical protein EV715DRAFT_294273 [Schizophyllum commune]